MNHEADKSEGTFLAQWIFFTSAGCILALPVSIIMAEICQPFMWGGKETNLVIAPCIAALVGCAQWIMLRQRIAVSCWWVLACAIGVGSPFVIGEILRRTGCLSDLPSGSHGKILGVAMSGIVGGLLSGLLQIGLLRSHFTRAGWWVLASALGWGICWVGILFNPCFGGIMGPILLGVVTGVGVLWMARLPVQKRNDAVESTNR
jgi:hypothetical protein